jgi:hypothetical protein
VMLDSIVALIGNRNDHGDRLTLRPRQF